MLVAPVDLTVRENAEATIIGVSLLLLLFRHNCSCRHAWTSSVRLSKLVQQRLHYQSPTEGTLIIGAKTPLNGNNPPEVTMRDTLALKILHHH